MNPADVITTEMLLPLIQASTRRKPNALVGIDCQQLNGGSGEAVAGLYRISGQAQDPLGKFSWSLVLKVLSPHGAGLTGSAAIPSGWNYWKREAEVYRSGLLKSLPPGLSAPLSFGQHANPDGTIWLWLEDVQGDDLPWTAERAGQAACTLGLWQGSFLSGIPIPSENWLSRYWLRGFTQESETMIQWLDRHQDDPNLVRVYPQDIARMTLQIWQHKDMLLGQLSHLPQVLCHLDFFCLNLIVRQRSGSNETVALDWAFTGQGALGEDLVPLILASLMFGGMGLDQAADLEGEVLAGYLSGLRQAGWKGDEHLVWEGYAAAGALRYGPSALRMVPLEALMAGILKLDGVTPFGITVQELGERSLLVQHAFTSRLAQAAMQGMA